MSIYIRGMYSKAGELLAAAEKTLIAAGIGEPRENAELLLAHVLGKSRLTFRAFPDLLVGEKQLRDFESLLARKAAGEPVAYITGRAAFMDYEFLVNPAVLVPRPETEELVVRAVEVLKPLPSPFVLDIGTGSGCIACTLALKSNARVTACDISDAALEAARANARALGAKVEFLKSDLFESVSGRFDLIVSNPPYIPNDEIPALAPEVRREPKSALDGGPDGLAILRCIISAAPEFLNPGGALMLETGSGQRKALNEMFDRTVWRSVESWDDFNGFDRYFLSRL